MDNLKEQEIDQILRHEIAKLKTAITYIEEAKTLANESSVKFSEMSVKYDSCLLYTSPSPRDRTRSRMPSSA